MAEDISCLSARDVAAGMSYCARTKFWRHASLLFDQMQRGEVQPDIFTCNAAINACEKGCQWQQAFSVFEEMPYADVAV